MAAVGPHGTSRRAVTATSGPNVRLAAGADTADTSELLGVGANRQGMTPWLAPPSPTRPILPHACARRLRLGQAERRGAIASLETSRSVRTENATALQSSGDEGTSRPVAHRS